MKIDLFKLNNYNHVDIDEDVIIPNEYYINADIIDIKDVHVTGSIDINYQDELVANLKVKGTFILPCAISLEEVSYDFAVDIDEIMGNFDTFYNKNKNTLDILPIIWENIVSEVPIRVVKEGISSHDIHGDGWELVSSD